MKYEYKFREIENNACLVMDLPKEIDVVTNFLFSDVQSSFSYDFFLKEIDSVLSGKEKHRVVSGNACVLDIRKKKTTVSCEYANFGEGEACEIETEELKELMLIWFEEQKKFKAKNGYKKDDEGIDKRKKV